MYDIVLSAKVFSRLPWEMYRPWQHKSELSGFNGWGEAHGFPLIEVTEMLN